MPIYTYQCQACGQVLEKRQSFTDAPLTSCETCGGELRKLLHPVGIVFKGSGFYNTDYRGQNGTAKPTEAAKAESGDGAKTTSTEGSSSGATSGETAAKTETSTAAAKSD